MSASAPINGLRAARQASGKRGGESKPSNATCRDVSRGFGGATWRPAESRRNPVARIAATRRIGAPSRSRSSATASEPSRLDDVLTCPIYGDGPKSGGPRRPANQEKIMIERICRIVYFCGQKFRGHFAKRAKHGPSRVNLAAGETRSGGTIMGWMDGCGVDLGRGFEVRFLSEPMSWGQGGSVQLRIRREGLIEPGTRGYGYSTTSGGATASRPEIKREHSGDDPRCADRTVTR